MDRKELETLSREALIEKATSLGVVRPRALTVPELIDEIVRADQRGARTSRGWFGRARDLLTSVIDRGLATDAKRPNEGRPIASAPPPLPTVTLAEIYAAQGHLERAIATLDEVLLKDPSHQEAAALRERFVAQVQKTKPSSPPPVLEAVPTQLESVASVGDAEPTAAEAKLEPEQAAPEQAAELASDSPAASDDAAEQAPVAELAAQAVEDADAEDDAEAELPTFEVDEVVALAIDPHTVYLYWEVRPATFAAARSGQASGALTIRVVTVVPGEPAPQTTVRDIEVEALFGELFLYGVPAQANVRVSIGYKSHERTTTIAVGAAVTTGEAVLTESADEFAPFAIGSSITTPRAAPSTDVARVNRSWSEAQAPQRPLAGDSFEWAETDGSDGLTARFPAGVWVDPSLRVVHVANLGESRDEARVTSWSNGASELVRSDIVWASNLTEASSFVHAGLLR